MATIVRFPGIYVNNVRYATLNSVSDKLGAGGSDLIGQDGWLGVSQGIVKGTVTVNGITPLAGSAATDLLQKFLNQEAVTVTRPVGDKVLKYKDCRITEMSLEAVRESGMATESLTFMTGQPEVVG